MEIYYTVTAISEEHMSESIFFRTEYNGDGDVVEEESWNPMNGGWTRYTEFTQGWHHVDENRNELMRAIKDYTTSDDFALLLGDVDEECFGRLYSYEYYCNHYVNEPKMYFFNIEINEVN